MFRRLPPFALSFAAVCLAGCSGAATANMTASLGARSLPAIQPPPYLPGPLDGESTKRQLALRRPVAVIIENFAPDSRPQSGLTNASMVIETLAEGGVTRFMAIFLEKDASQVGPVRSTRMYFDHWASSFHAILSHVGGNDDAQAYLLWHHPPVFNIDENHWEKSLFDTGTSLFWRSSRRVAPHNVYTSTYTIRSYAARHHQDWAYTQAYIMHTHQAPPGRRGRAGSISIDFVNPLYPQPDADYNVRYVYNRATNTYLRYMGGAPHVDAATGKALRPSNIVIVKTGPAVADPNAGPTPQSILIPTVGTGVAWFFLDGKVIKGRWSQRDQYAPLRFFGGRGRQVKFNPGQTWVEVVPPDSPVTWQLH